MQLAREQSAWKGYILTRTAARGRHSWRANSTATMDDGIVKTSVGWSESSSEATLKSERARAERGEQQGTLRSQASRASSVSHGEVHRMQTNCPDACVMQSGALAAASLNCLRRPGAQCRPIRCTSLPSIRMHAMHPRRARALIPGTRLMPAAPGFQLRFSAGT